MGEPANCVKRSFSFRFLSLIRDVKCCKETIKDGKKQVADAGTIVSGQLSQPNSLRPKAYTLRAAAHLLGVCHTTLSRWIRDGVGPRTFIQPGLNRSTYRIMPEAMQQFINRNSKGGRSE